MTRIFSFLIALAAVVAVFYMPEGPRSKLGVLTTYQAVLGVDVPVDPEEPDGEQTTLAELWFASPAWNVRGEGQAGFMVGGARLADATKDSDVDLIIHADLREAILRALRQVLLSKQEEDQSAENALALERGDGAPPANIKYEIVGAKGPAVNGVNFFVELKEDSLEITWNVAGGPAQSRSLPFKPASPLSLLPPLVAIALAVLLRRPVLSLFIGVFAGAMLLQMDTDAGLFGQGAAAFGNVFSVYFMDQFTDPDQAKVVGFVIAMLAMVGVITKNGGIAGVMNIVAKMAKSARSTQLATYFMGLAVFFDDYANTILVGSTMRPLTDKFRIAREKLAYIVDSTAAPVAGLSIFSTWIAFEVSTFSAQLPMAGMRPEDGYSIFIATLPYRFYCILSLAFVFLVTFTGRDFGPMLKAERRARTTGLLVREGGTPMVSEMATDMAPAEGITIRAWRALVPLAVFIGLTVYTILSTGGAFEENAPSLFSFSGLSAILGAGDSYEGLWRGSSWGLLVAVLASLAAGLKLEIVDAAVKTLMSMGVALGILYLAWMIGAVCGDLNTAHYLTVVLDNLLFPLALPVILFLLSGLIAFSTGSSWSTMSILLPLVVGLSYSLGEQTDAIDAKMLMILSIGAVLEGAIFGDHCSPISDTTVLSSVASASDHIDHVRTQGPYSVFVMLVAIVVGYLPSAAFGLHPALSLLSGVLVLWLGLRILGERVDDEVPDGSPSTIPE